MKSILKVYVGMFIGLATFIILILGFIFVVNKVSYLKAKSSLLSQHHLLKLKIEGKIEERKVSALQQMLFDAHLKRPLVTPSSLKEIIRKAQEHEGLDYLYIEVNPFDASFSDLESIRQELVAFRKKGKEKKIYIHLESLDEKSLYLASAADRVGISPYSSVLLKGVPFIFSFFTKLMGKLDVKAKTFRAGKFKSAIEPFIYNQLSNENRQQLEELSFSLWDHFLETVSTARNIKKELLKKSIDNLVIKDVPSLVKFNLVDEVLNRSSFQKLIYNEIEEKYPNDVKFLISKGETKDKKMRIRDYFPLITLESHLFKNYLSAIQYDENKKFEEKKHLGVMYLSGEIVFGYSSAANSKIGHLSVIEELNELLKDKNLAGIILRIDSPGGSAYASDLIYQELEEIRKEYGLPIYASFGPMAASGAYYLAMAADKIWASENTITGSIGVFSLLFETKNFFKDTIGVTFDSVVSSKYADLGNSNRDLSKKESQYFQSSVDEIYQRFLDVVQMGRKFEDRKKVDSYAQGRIYSGKMAKELKLVDEIGSLKDVIDSMADSLNLKKGDYFTTIAVPESENFWGGFFSRDEVLSYFTFLYVGKYFAPAMNYLMIEKNERSPKIYMKGPLIYSEGQLGDFRPY